MKKKLKSGWQGAAARWAQAQADRAAARLAATATDGAEGELGAKNGANAARATTRRDERGRFSAGNLLGAAANATSGAINYGAGSDEWRAGGGERARALAGEYLAQSALNPTGTSHATLARYAREFVDFVAFSHGLNSNLDGAAGEVAANAAAKFVVTAADVVAYKNELINGRGLAQTSLANATRAAVRLCKFLARRGAYSGEVEWLDNFKAGKNEGAARDIGAVLDVAQVRRLLDWLGQQSDIHWRELYHYCTIAFNTGARTGEILALTAADFDFANGVLTINKTLHANGQIAPNTKTGKSRCFRVAAAVLDAARAQIALNAERGNVGERLFVGRGKGGGAAAYAYRYRIACKTALGVENTRLYNTRHAFVTQSINRDFNQLAAVSKIVGHAKISTTLDNYYQNTATLDAGLVSPFGADDEGGEL